MNSRNHECNRKEDLVAYLYGEATAAEKRSFEQHLSECSECGEELKAFGRVRDDLSGWQVGVAPRTELALPRTKMEVLRELIGLFPVWARGLAMVGAAAAIVFVAMSFYRLNGVSTPPTASGMSEQQVQAMVSKAVADERAKMQQQYQADFAGLKTQLAAEYQAQLQIINAEHQNKLESVKAGLRAEIKKSNQQNGSLRSFFAVEDDRSYPWGDTR
ncbi:MAG: zf-HC2 domain-containing protein [Acidobacteria bacterium]|nr:zf-HC2 domain-containing protein [Acidobacteriota bacterium]